MCVMLVSLSIIAVFALSATARQGEIAFVSGADPASRRVVTLNLADGAIRDVGPGEADAEPCWDAKGQRLAFVSGSAGARHVLIADLTSGAVEPIPHARPINSHPRWSGSGQFLAYGSALEDGESVIAVYDLKKREERIWGGDGGLGLLAPVWMEGGSLFAFVNVAQALGWKDEAQLALLREASSSGLILAIARHRQEASTELCLVTPSTMLPIPEAFMPSPGRYEEWGIATHPRSRSIAFESNDGGDREIFVLSFTKGAYDLSNHRAADWNPQWAPNGETILFESFRDGRRGLYRVYPETTHVTQVAASPDHDNWSGAFSPMGEDLVFVSNRDGSPELYIQPMGEVQARRLTEGVYALSPAWRPDGSQN